MGVLYDHNRHVTITQHRATAPLAAARAAGRVPGPVMVFSLAVATAGQATAADTPGAASSYTVAELGTPGDNFSVETYPPAAG